MPNFSLFSKGLPKCKFENCIFKCRSLSLLIYYRQGVLENCTRKLLECHLKICLFYYYMVSDTKSLPKFMLWSTQGFSTLNSGVMMGYILHSHKLSLHCSSGLGPGGHCTKCNQHCRFQCTWHCTPKMELDSLWMLHYKALVMDLYFFCSPPKGWSRAVTCELQTEHWLIASSTGPTL